MGSADDFAGCVVAVVIPLRTVSAANIREHWTKKYRRRKSERLAVAAYLGRDLAPLRTWTGPIVVTLRRYGKRALDDDNLAGSFKSIRDEVATCLGRDDGPNSGIRWVYEQTRGDYVVAIEVVCA